MSATKVKDRLGSHLDFYETPAYVTEGLLNTGFCEGSKTLLEPCAGKGAIVSSVLSHHPHLQITAVEIQESFAATLQTLTSNVLVGNFLDMELPVYDCIIANPPFSQAETFIRKAIQFLSEEGKMAFLLRLPFLASVKRYQLFQEIPPERVWILSQRPKFGGTNIDSCDYCWVIFNNHRRNQTILDWIVPV